jgi:hypothetical protein
MLQLLIGVATAADIHLELATADGVSETATFPTTETFSGRYGPVSKGSRSTVYTVSVMPSVFDPLEGVYRVELYVCTEWSKGRKHDQHCQKSDVPAPPEASGPKVTEVAIKAPGGGKFSWVAKTWFTGESPPTGAGPQKVEEPEEEL